MVGIWGAEEVLLAGAESGIRKGGRERQKQAKVCSASHFIERSRSSVARTHETFVRLNSGPTYHITELCSFRQWALRGFTSVQVGSDPYEASNLQ